MNPLVKMHNIQNKALRDPLQVTSASFRDCGISNDSLALKANGQFYELLKKLNITLFVSREYEHLLLSLYSGNKNLIQTFFPLPHPSGLAFDRTKQILYAASTRNPNAIYRFSKIENVLMPASVKFYPGASYFHDLAIIKGNLYANAVGKNGVLKVNFSSTAHEDLAWWPKCTELRSGKPDIRANYIQLNSIGAGNSLENSYFTASGSGIGKLRPGHPDYPVDKTGVVFSGKTREVIAGGLTRPHSAKIYRGKLWLNNSGYGEFGFIRKNEFVPLVKLPGWTRGLCFCKDIAFVGVSKVLPRFSQYAPGISGRNQTCGIYAVSIKTGEIIGSVTWKNGNQIFAIDFADSMNCSGFLFKEARTGQKEKMVFYNYQP